MNEKEIQLHKLIDSGKEAEAIALLDSDESIDVNFEYNQRIPIFSAINQHMYDLYEKIVNNPNFNSKTEDGFGVTLLESLIYLYDAEQFEDESTEKYNERVEVTERMIKAIINVKSYTYDFNAKDINEDTAINIACECPKALWIVEALAAKEDVDLNVINDFQCTSLTNAIRNKNTEAIKVLAKRSDLLVRDYDLEIAKKFDVKLEDYGIDTSKFKVTDVEVATEAKSAFAMVCE